VKDISKGKEMDEEERENIIEEENSHV